jgi:uncharacterized protein (DUF2236 family)
MTVPAASTGYPISLSSTRTGQNPSVSRKINREVVLLLGWGPAILCQLAHPLVAAGVAEHSSFRAHPRERVRRFRGTLGAMLALTFGSPDEMAKAAAGINAIHDRVHGRLTQPAGRFGAGTGYSAHDPELLRWVHATMLDLMPRTFEQYVAPLTEDEKDRYCLEASGVEPLLGIPRGFLPASMAELQKYMEIMLASDQIVVTPTARMLAREVLSPPLLAAARPLLWMAQLATVGLLPPAIRAAYGFRWNWRREAAHRLCAGLTRHLLALTPPLIRHWPAARQAESSPHGARLRPRRPAPASSAVP